MYDQSEESVVAEATLSRLFILYDIKYYIIYK